MRAYMVVTSRCVAMRAVITQPREHEFEKKTFLSRKLDEFALFTHFLAKLGKSLETCWYKFFRLS